MYKNPMINKNPMAFKSQQYRPQPPRLPPYINRTVLPTKEIDPLMISTLLLKVSTDDINILELGNFILSNGITTNDMINEDGESILHLIISNQNLSDKKKLEIIKYLGANFNLLLSYDKNGRTPLHIAVQNQLYDIATELINTGHDVNAVDNGFKSPLHYAVIGKNIDAPQKIDKTLIPDKKIKIKSDLIKNITDNLVKFMQDTPEINMFFANQYTTLDNSKYIFQQEIYDKMNSSDVYNQMIQILQNPQLTTEQKQKKIFEISADVNTSVKTLLSTKLDLAKKEIKLESNMENGWGPSSSITDKIMPYKKYEELKESFTTKKEILIQHLKEKLPRELDVLQDNLKTMAIDIKEMENFTRKLIFSHNFYKTLTQIVDPNPPNEYFFNDIYGLEINQSIIDQFLYNNIPQTIYSTLLNKKTNYYLTTNQYSPEDGVTQIPFDNSYLSLIIDSNHYFKDKDKDENEINNLLKDYDDDHQLSYSVADDISDHPIETNDIHTIKSELYRKSDGSLSYYNTTCMNIYFKPLFLEEIQNNLIKNISDIVMTNMDNFDVDILFNINNVILSILNCTNTLPKLIKEYDNLILSLNKLKSDLGNIPSDNNKIINGNNHNLTILHIHLHHEIDRLIKQFEKNKSELQTKFLNTFRNLYLYVNQIIDYVNLNHSIKYITMYFNNFGNPTNIQTELIQNIFYGSINKFPEYFKSYEEITGLLSLNNEQVSEQTNKRKLIEKFLCQFNRFNLNKYIGDASTVEAIGVNGYLKTDTTNNNISNLDIVLADLKIKYDEKTDDDNYKYNKGDATKLGLLETATGKQFDKKDKSFPIIAPFIGEFYMIQKYIIIRVLIQKLFDIFNGTTAITLQISELKKWIDKLNTDIIDNIKPNPEDHSILLISLAKIIDKIYNANLENIINITTNNYGYRYVRETTNPTDYKIINVTELNKINISELNIDDLKKSILKIFKRNKKSKFFNYAEDILVKKIKDSNIYKITGDVIGNVPNELYYKYNKNILELLLEKGASLNNKDKDGNTPLILALLQNNDSAIKYILEEQQFQNISVYNKASRNRFGAKPYDICAKSLKVVIDNFDNEISNKNLELLTKEVNDKISSLTKINHNMRFSNIIFRMLVYLLNHDLYSMLNSYKFQKDESFHQYFFTKITLQIKKLPLLENIDLIFGSYHGVINDVLKEDKRKLLKENEQKTNLEKEEDLLEEELNSKPNRFRKREISLLKSQKLLKIGEFTRQLKKSPELKYDEYNMDTNDIELNLDSNIKFLQKIKSKNILPSTDILTMYNNIFDEILRLNTDDYRTYPALWENLFNLQDTTKKTDDTQIINKILEKLKNVIAMKDIKKLDKDMIKMITITINLLKQHINDYFELPFVYAGDNYVLDKIIDIYEHILKNTMLVNLYHIIEKLVRLELIDKLPMLSNERKYYKDLDDDVEKIMNTTVLNLSIKKYLFEIIPKKVLKVSLQIYENEDDEDRNTNLINIFDFINKLLEANTETISIKSDSKIIKTLNTYVYPYFKEYLDANIKMMKKITDGYFSMIISLEPKLEIFDMIIKKAISEK